MKRRNGLSFIVLLVYVLAGLGLGAVLGLIIVIGFNLPQVQALEHFEPGAATRIFSADGEVLSQLYTERRLPLPYEEIPLMLRQAVIAVEDRRFHRHPGMDMIRNIGALIADIRAGKIVEGGSTITQQLARNLFLSADKTLQRKLKEVFLALQIERRYTKEEILTLYLNQIYFGDGSYGIGAAADLYFGKSVDELTLGEYALLAGLPQAPSLYSPHRHPDRALARRKIVLAAMVRARYIDKHQADLAEREPLKLATPRPGRGPAPQFTKRVTQMILDQFGENAVYKGGLTVKTTLNMERQRAAENALQRGLEDLAGEFPDSRSSAGLIALETVTGGILAWAEQPMKSDEDIRTNPAVITPGSALMPIIYAAAVESGLTQADRIVDAPVSYTLPDRSEPWLPENIDRRHEGEITLRRALEVSGVTPAVKVLSRVGLDNVLFLARKMGISSRLERDLTLALGNSPVSCLELATAYNTLASRGLMVEPHAVSEVLDRSDRVIYRSNPKRTAALSPETAYIVTDMLSGVIKDGTGQRATILEGPLAGQTGTTPDFDNALFVGYSPHITAAAWVEAGKQALRSRRFTGARCALPIWIDFMYNRPTPPDPRDFEQPVGVSMMYMDRFTGAHSNPANPDAVLAAFRQGTSPRKAP